MPVGIVNVEPGLNYGSGAANVQVTNASAVLLAAHPNRRHAIFLNQDASAAAYLNIAATAVIGLGIKLGPGDSYEMTPGRNLTTAAIYAIAASTINVSVLQGVDAGAP